MPRPNGIFTPQEKAFVAYMAETGDQTYAARRAGYSSPQQRGSANMAKPAVLAAVREAQQALLYGQMRDTALRVVQQIMSDETASNRDRISAAKIVLDKTDAAPDSAGERDISSLSAAELARLTEEARARLEALRIISPVIDAEAATLPTTLPNEPGVFA